MKQRWLDLSVWLSVLAALLTASAGCSEGPADGAPEGIVVDAKARTVALPAAVAKQGTYRELKGAIEYVLVGKGGKVYETAFVTDSPVEEIHQALLEIGLRPGEPGEGGRPPRGMPIHLFVEYHSHGKQVRRRLDEFVLRVRAPAGTKPAPAGTKPAPAEPLAPLEPAAWLFTGSSSMLDPGSGELMLAASLTESIIGLHWSDRSVLLANPRPESRRENIYRANLAALPPPGTAVRIVFRRLRGKVAEGTRRVHVLAGGRLRGVGYTTFIAGRARRLEVNGFIRELLDGRVEAVVEGPGEAVAELLAKMRQGPLGAVVEDFQATEEQPEGDFQTFQSWH